METFQTHQNLTRILQEIKPDEVYNLGAQSHVAVSFESPEYTTDVDAMGNTSYFRSNSFTGLREEKPSFIKHLLQSFMVMFKKFPKRKTTPFYPRSPYGVAKLYAYWITVNYRESYGIYACNGILFNHESPRRGETFVYTKKLLEA